MNKDRMDIVHDHFNHEAKMFDSMVLINVPHYIEMVEALTTMLPFSKNDKITIADIGTGTGNIALAAKTSFPNSRIVCIDMSQNMLDTAKEKLKDFADVEYILADITNYKFDRKFDAIIYMWKDFMLRSSNLEFVQDRYKKYLTEDRPTTLLNELASLKKIGFKSVEVFWKYYNFAVYGGIK